MMPLFATYIPSMPKTIVALIVQLLLFGILARALFAFSRKRHHPMHVLVALTLGALVGWFGGLAYQCWPLYWQAASVADVWQHLTQWLLFAYTELHWAAPSTFFGILASWLSLEIVGPLVIRRPRGS